MYKTPLNKILIAPMLLTLGACSSGSDNDDDTGTLSLNITDAPIGNVTNVFVQFTGVTLKPASGEAIEFLFDDPNTTEVETKTIDLLALQGMASQALLESEEVPAGAYNQIRLHVNAEFDGENDSYVVLEGGGTKELRIPSGSQSGLKLNTPFTVAAGTSDIAVGNDESIYTIDFNLAKSVINPGGQPGYFLKPVLRLVQNIETGSIAGNINSGLLDAECSDNILDTGNAVYAYSGAGITPDDVGGTVEPLTTALVNLNNDSGLYEYEIGYLSAGEYTVAFTCQADLETEDDDAIVFVAPATKTVVAGETTEHNF